MLPLRASGPLQQSGGLRETPGHPRDGRLGIAPVRQVDATLHDQSRIVRIERQRALQVVVALRKLSLDQREAAQDAMALGIVLVDAHRLLDQLDHALLAFPRARHELVAQRLSNGTGFPRVGERETRILRDRAVEVRLGLTVGLLRLEVIAGFATQEMVVGMPPTPSPAPPSPFAWGSRDRVRELLAGDFDLQFEQGVAVYFDRDGAAVWDAFVTGYGPTKTLAKSLDESRRRELQEGRQYLITLGTRK